MILIIVLYLLNADNMRRKCILDGTCRVIPCYSGKGKLTLLSKIQRYGKDNRLPRFTNYIHSPDLHKTDTIHT